MPTILRKSLTACEQLAALPPTPSRNSLPPCSRNWAKAAAIRSIASVSSRSRTRRASSKNLAANPIPRPPDQRFGVGQPLLRTDLVEPLIHLIADEATRGHQGSTNIPEIKIFVITEGGKRLALIDADAV